MNWIIVYAVVLTIILAVYTALIVSGWRTERKAKRKAKQATPEKERAYSVTAIATEVLEWDKQEQQWRPAKKVDLIYGAECIMNILITDEFDQELFSLKVERYPVPEPPNVSRETLEEDDDE